MPESIASTFKCYSCGRQSEYAGRHKEMLMEWFDANRMTRPETRTYKCTQCGASNQITMLPMEWDLIIHANS
jgi:DNA-directed RNA polymerase subunit RPC12/RpoP